MMKPRTSRVINERTVSGTINKSETSANGVSIQVRNQAQLMNNQQTSAQAIRKRRSSINVYDQPSSLNSRLRQLETDMLRLDEDRTKLFDDTHSALAQYELRLNEILSILKSRQDNVEKYVEDMKLLLLAKEEFEKQAKLLNEKHDRIHEKFMHRETTISREIKLLKNKFELLEKNRQFKSILQKSSNSFNSIASDTNINDLNLGLESNEFQTNDTAATRTRSETKNSDSLQSAKDGGDLSVRNSSNQFQNKQKFRSVKNVRMKLSRFNQIGKFVTRLFKPAKGNKLRKKSNRISSLNLSEENQLTKITSTTNPQSSDSNGYSDSKNNNNKLQLNNDRPIESSVNFKTSKITNLKRVGLFSRLLKS